MVVVLSFIHRTKRKFINSNSTNIYSSTWFTLQYSFHGGFNRFVMSYTVTLKGGSPWGFRFQGGCDFHEPIKVAKVSLQQFLLLVKTSETKYNYPILVNIVNNKLNPRNLTTSFYLIKSIYNAGFYLWNIFKPKRCFCGIFIY